LNNVANLHHLTNTQYDGVAHKMEIILRPQICDVTSPYVYSLILHRNRPQNWVYKTPITEQKSQHHTYAITSIKLWLVASLTAATLIMYLVQIL